MIVNNEGQVSESGDAVHVCVHLGYVHVYMYVYKWYRQLLVSVCNDTCAL